MRTSIYSLIFILFLCGIPQLAAAGEKFEALIPDHSKLQYAGSIGTVSASAGWSYGKQDKWESDLALGIVAAQKYTDAMVVISLKQSFTPWDLELGERAKRLTFNPLTCSIFLSNIPNNIDDDYWLSEPSKYGSYYRFSSSLRLHFGLGQRLNYHFGERAKIKTASLYYELSTCDLEFISAFTNAYLKPQDILSLAFGMRLFWGK